MALDPVQLVACAKRGQDPVVGREHAGRAQRRKPCQRGRCGTSSCHGVWPSFGVQILPPALPCFLSFSLNELYPYTCCYALLQKMWRDARSAFNQRALLCVRKSLGFE